MERGHVARHNQKAFGLAEVERYYAEDALGSGLVEEEKAILARFGSQWAGKPVLDIGVGGGRTTPHLRNLSDHYIGIDFVEQMVRRCRQRFPGVDFRCCDARNLGAFAAGAFEVVWFSYNGIDYVSPEDRWLVLNEVHRVLKPGGAFVFSSHNLAAPPTIPSMRLRFVFDANPLRLARRNLTLLRYHVADFLNYWRNRPYEYAGPGYAVRVDAAHQYRLLTCYVTPGWQVEQLETLGFRAIMLFGRNGSFVDHHSELSDPWLYYVAFKGESPADA